MPEMAQSRAARQQAKARSVVNECLHSGSAAHSLMLGSASEGASSSAGFSGWGRGWNGRLFFSSLPRARAFLNSASSVKGGDGGVAREGSVHFA